MTKFTDYSGTEKKGKETVFTHCFNVGDGWVETQNTPKKYKEVKYLGNRGADGDMFTCYSSSGNVQIFKGTKGDEF